MSGTAWLMAALIYGGGLRVSECCELRIKDIDFDQGLVVVRGGKGDNDRSTLLAEGGRKELRAQLCRSEAIYRADRKSSLAGVWLPDALDTDAYFRPAVTGCAGGRITPTPCSIAIRVPNGCDRRCSRSRIVLATSGVASRGTPRSAPRAV